MGNARVNTTWNEDTDPSFPGFREIIFFVSGLISICGLVVNGAVIWLLGFIIKRNPLSVYILNLASADFIFLLSTIMLVIVLLFNQNLYILNLFMSGLSVTSCLVDLGLVAAIDSECCLCVLFPVWFRCHRPTHLSTTTCTLIWGLPFCSGVLVPSCGPFEGLPCKMMNFVFYIVFPLTFLVLCVSSLSLLIRVQCCSWQRQLTELYVTVFLRVLTFRLCGQPVGVSELTRMLSRFPPYCRVLLLSCFLLSTLNSSLNPLIYFFIGRQRQGHARRPLSKVLQSAAELRTEV